MAKRLEFSRKTKAKIIERAAGRCEKCKAALKAGDGQVDHILPCELGGQPTVANGRLICIPCHKEKTAADVRQIRKSDRQRDKFTGAMRKPSTLTGQGFPKRQREKPPLTKVVPRGTGLYQERSE
ncbi:MAG: HNH endonuclease [Allorhizobium sp.]